MKGGVYRMLTMKHKSPLGRMTPIAILDAYSQSGQNQEPGSG